MGAIFVSALAEVVGAATGLAVAVAVGADSSIARFRATMMPTAPMAATTVMPIAAASTYFAALGACCCCCCAIAATIDGPV